MRGAHNGGTMPSEEGPVPRYQILEEDNPPDNATVTKVKYNKRTTAKILGIAALAAIGIGVFTTTKDHILQLASMQYRQNIAEPKYTGNWGKPHTSEGETLWEEMRLHNLPGDLRYWREIIGQYPENSIALSDGYQKGDKIQIPTPDEFGR